MADIVPRRPSPLPVYVLWTASAVGLLVGIATFGGRAPSKQLSFEANKLVELNSGIVSMTGFVVAVLAFGLAAIVQRLGD